MALHQNLSVEAILVLACYTGVKPCVHYAQGIFLPLASIPVWLINSFCLVKPRQRIPIFVHGDWGTTTEWKALSFLLAGTPSSLSNP